MDNYGNQTTTLSYLPLAHCFERGIEHGAYVRGWLTYYSTGNIKNLTKDLALSKPSMLLGVPRVYTKIY